MNTLLLRTISFPDCTIGRLRYGGFDAFTLELPWLNNKTDASCIPSGLYEWFKRESTGNGSVLELRNVPGRTYIQMHAGNYTRQTKGCILVGDRIMHINDDLTPDVGNSVATLNRLLSAVGDTGRIQIMRAFADEILE